MSPYCPVRHRESETLLTLRKLLTAARSTAVVYSTIRLPTNPTQITDAMNQRYFVQMAQWRLVHTNEDPPDRINRTPQRHESNSPLQTGPSMQKKKRIVKSMESIESVTQRVVF